MPANVVKPSGALTIAAVAGTTLLLLIASASAILSLLIGQNICSETQAQAEPPAQC